MANTVNQDKAKRVNFTWKTIHEDLLLREVLLLEPFQYRQGTKEKGTVRSKIAENLTELGMKANQRSAWEKFDKLVTEFERKQVAEKRASGVDVKYTERDRAMVDILERMNENEVALESKKDKDIQEEATAEDMRKKATERVGETRITHYNTVGFKSLSPLNCCTFEPCELKFFCRYKNFRS